MVDWESLIVDAMRCDSDIFRACENLVAPNENEALAVDARQEVDLRTGAAFTRFQTLRFQAKFKDLDRCVLSYGISLERERDGEH